MELRLRDLPITLEQQAELDRRLEAYEHDANPSRPADEVVAEIRKALEICGSASP